MRRLFSAVLPPRLALLSFAHFSIDAFSSFFPPLLPLLKDRFHLTLAGVGTVVALSATSSSFLQVPFGLVSDRMRRPWFTTFGPPVAALFLSAIGLAPSFTVLIALLMLGGLGVAAFHPQSAVLASGLSTRRSLAMSFFVTGGTLGFSLGPLYSTTVLQWFGLNRTWLAALPGLLVFALLATQFQRLTPHPHERTARAPLRELRPVVRPLALLYTAVVCRSAVSYGYMTFLPIHLRARGFPVSSWGLLLTAYLGFGALGGFLGGWLADRWGGRRVVRNSFLGALPLYVAFNFMPDVPGLVCLILGSFVLQGSLPVNVVLGQELSPRHSSLISSLLMGAAWGVGALLVIPIGMLADRFGLQTALLALSGMLLLGIACALSLPATVDRRVETVAFAGAAGE